MKEAKRECGNCRSRFTSRMQPCKERDQPEEKPNHSQPVQRIAYYFRAGFELDGKLDDWGEIRFLCRAVETGEIAPVQRDKATMTMEYLRKLGISPPAGNDLHSEIRVDLVTYAFVDLLGPAKFRQRLFSCLGNPRSCYWPGENEFFAWKQ